MKATLHSSTVPEKNIINKCLKLRHVVVSLNLNVIQIVDLAIIVIMHVFIIKLYL